MKIDGQGRCDISKYCEHLIATIKVKYLCVGTCIIYFLLSKLHVARAPLLMGTIRKIEQSQEKLTAPWFEYKIVPKNE